MTASVHHLRAHPDERLRDEIAEAWRPDTRVTAHDLCEDCNPDPDDERPF